MLSKCATSLGRSLAALHAVPPAGLGLPGDTLRRTGFASRMPLLEERLRSLSEAGLTRDPVP